MKRPNLGGNCLEEEENAQRLFGKIKVKQTLKPDGSITMKPEMRKF